MEKMKTVTVVSCCGASRGAKHQKDYETLAIRLARSIRRNGGIYKDCDIAFWLDEDYKPSVETIARLESYNCTLTWGRLAIDNVPMSSKIAACCLEFDTDYVIWMDTDIYVLGDFSDLIADVDVMVSPDTRNHHPWTREEDSGKWDEYYAYFGLKNPNIKIITHVDKQPGNFYFCAGLFVFRNGIDFGNKYLEVAKAILSSEMEDYAFDQMALPITIVKYGLSWGIIPEYLHYIYAIHGHKLDYDGVQIVHYQDGRISEVPEEEWVV